MSLLPGSRPSLAAYLKPLALCLGLLGSRVESQAQEEAWRAPSGEELVAQEQGTKAEETPELSPQEPLPCAPDAPGRSYNTVMQWLWSFLLYIALDMLAELVMMVAKKRSYILCAPLAPIFLLHLLGPFLGSRPWDKYHEGWAYLLVTFLGEGLFLIGGRWWLFKTDGVCFAWMTAQGDAKHKVAQRLIGLYALHLILAVLHERFFCHASEESKPLSPPWPKPIPAQQDQPMQEEEEQSRPLPMEKKQAPPEELNRSVSTPAPSSPNAQVIFSSEATHNEKKNEKLLLQLGGRRGFWLSSLHAKETPPPRPKRHRHRSPRKRAPRRRSSRSPRRTRHSR